MPSNRSRNRRRGQRLRGRVHYHKIINQIHYGMVYSNSGGNFQFANIGPQLTNVDSSAPNPALMYMVLPNFYDIYSNADFEQRTELDGLANVYAQRRLCRFKVSLTPRVSEVFVGTGDPSSSVTSGQTGPMSPYIMFPWYDSLSGIQQAIPNGDHTRAYADVRGCKQFRSDRPGSLIVRPRVGKVAPAGLLLDQGPSAFTGLVVTGTQPSPWVSTAFDSAGVARRSTVINYGIGIAFPAGIKPMQYDMRITYYIAYRHNY